MQAYEFGGQNGQKLENFGIFHLFLRGFFSFFFSFFLSVDGFGQPVIVEAYPTNKFQKNWLGHFNPAGPARQ